MDKQMRRKRATYEAMIRLHEAAAASKKRKDTAQMAARAADLRAQYRAEFGVEAP